MDIRPATVPKLQEVFVRSGPVTYTFVEPVEFGELTVALDTPGRSIVIEGPSGIGKTTSIDRALVQLSMDTGVKRLTGRVPPDIKIIQELSRNVPFGTVVIDDFHRLSSSIKRDIADLMKTLADAGATHSKLIVIGIPNVGQSLIAFGRDLANRIEVIKFEANPEFKVLELLEKGEEALNVSLNVKDEIVTAAQGSFYIAQILAHVTCLKSGVLRRQNAVTTTTESFESVKDKVMKELATKFHDVAVMFCRGTKLRREGRAPYLHILSWLSQSANWSINLDREIDKHPTQRGSVSQVVSKGYLASLLKGNTLFESALHFDESNRTLVAQDPQFVFYLRNLSWPRLAEEAGYVSSDFPGRYDFALSFAGADRAIAAALFQALTDLELEVFYDLNEQHRIIAQDVEEYLGPIYRSDALMIVCILGKEYPTKIWTKFEGEQFKGRFRNGEVVPIVLDSTQLGQFDSAASVGYIPWKTAEPVEPQAKAVAALLATKIVEIRKRRVEKSLESPGSENQ
ncbi:TPA: TIR domain-containing protein [Stenotrophomonas maltophilia]|nr:TIR domain-containing protein [Stenotrophomonas maltophilia]HEL7675774.1 TIR domain-containing protein [Stenotrophomonas maltophilia]